MKPRRYFQRGPTLFGAALRYGTPVCIGFSVLISGLDARAGDLARNIAALNRGAAAPAAGTTLGGTTPAATDAARANAQDMLARTTNTLNAMRALQAAARAAAAQGPNNLGTLAVPRPSVPNGLAVGGLHATGGNTQPSQWIGAAAPTQAVADGKTAVTIKQTTQQALLNWDTFNIGKETTLTFDQTAGGQNASQWIAFNFVHDPGGNPSQILGSIKAAGQVYLINQNGIIFGGS
ncbi:MAG: filamentous hemagglutinin N-terminal domain-containing protein, partial [Verrucomicrobiota bacterium]